MLEIAVLLSSQRVGKLRPLTVPGEPHDTALGCSVGSDGGEMGEERSLQQVEMRFWQIGLGHSWILRSGTKLESCGLRPKRPCPRSRVAPALLLKPSLRRRRGRRAPRSPSFGGRGRESKGTPGRRARY